MCVIEFFLPRVKQKTFDFIPRRFWILSANARVLDHLSATVHFCGKEGGGPWGRKSRLTRKLVPEEWVARGRAAGG